jgi:EAL domain-containing protein (putative c-di-GMP-specific phosphodiesterase class I)/PAS domain-containing protein
MTCAAVAVSCTAALCLLACYLPVLMRGDGLNTRHAGPFLVLVVALATMLSWLGARSRAGPEKWAVVTAGSSLGYVVLTFTVHYRFSAGWYAGMVLTVAASAAVMLALLGEFRAMKADLAQEGEQLSAALQQAVQLQRVQRTLLDNMVDGVEFRGPDGDLVVSNLAAPELLDMSVEQMAGLVPPGPGWKAARPDGSEWAPFASSTMDAVRTGLRHRGEVVVVSTRDGRSRWLRANSVVVRDAHGSIEGVVTTFTDVTDTYGEEARLAQENQTKRERVERVLHGHEPCLRVVYQPIIDLLSRQLMGFEALSRFVSGTPDEWFSDAAAVGLGVELELHALRMAFVKHYRVPEGAYLSVNVSPQTVVSPLLADLLEGSPCERIVLEITEHVGIEDYGTLSRSLERLRSRGVRIAVDDAGAGYASLRHVLNMRPDIIKLDVGLTRGIDADPVREALAVALASFGEKIGAVLVAEGIETQSELEALVRIGLRHGQGYYLGRPADLPWCVPAENIPNCGPPTSGRGTGEA